MFVLRVNLNRTHANLILEKNNLRWNSGHAFEEYEGNFLSFGGYYGNNAKNKYRLSFGRISESSYLNRDSIRLSLNVIEYLWDIQ